MLPFSRLLPTKKNIKTKEDKAFINELTSKIIEEYKKQDLNGKYIHLIIISLNITCTWHDIAGNLLIWCSTSYKCIYFPNVIDSWNLLDVDTQNQHSRLMYKKQIRSNISVTPPYFALGTRKYNIFHCQLRNLASNLNQHKFLSHLSDGSGCPCGDDVEDNFHYFYVCPLFICQRILLFTQLRNLPDFLNIDVLLKGSHDLSFDDNVLIMNSVHTFICGTKRLDY